MTDVKTRKGLTRRELLSRTVAAGATFVVGAGFVASTDAAWALETTELKPETMATLIQMARDIYPHDHVADEYYAVAVKGYDSAEAAPAVVDRLGTRPRRHPARHGGQRLFPTGARRSGDRAL